MDKLTAIKIKYQDGTYSDEIPISALAENVQWDNTHNLIDILGNIDIGVSGSVQDQISQLFNEKVSASEVKSYITPIQNQINQLFNEKLDSEDMPTYVNPLQDQINSLSSTKVSDSDMKTYTDPLQNQIDQLSITKVSDSDMQSYIRDSLPVYVSEWLDTKVDPIGSAVTVDDTLTISGSAADSKKVGRELNNIKSNLNQYVDIFTGNVGKSVENWLNEHPEATTTVEDDSLTTEKYQDNSITNKKIVDKSVTEDKLSDDLIFNHDTNKFADLKFFNSYYFPRTIFTEDESHVMQGGTGHDEKFYMLIPSRDYKSGNIIEVDPTNPSAPVLRRASVTNGKHMNDIAYCDIDNCFYIATCENNICKIDATTLEQKTDVILDNALDNIVWDNINQWFFGQHSTTYYKYTYDWVLLDTGEASYRYDGWAKSLSGQNGQALFLFGKYYGFIANYVTNTSLYIRNVFIIFDPITLKTICEFNFPGSRGDDEVQWAYYDFEKGILYAVSGNYAIRYYKAYVDKTKGNEIRDIVQPINTTGYPLAEGTDLTSIIKPGYYYADSRKSIPIKKAPGYYDNGDAQFLQMPFGLHGLLGLFFTGTRASLRYNDKYYTFLTHKDLTFETKTVAGYPVFIYTFMDLFGIVFGTISSIECDSVLTIPLIFDKDPSYLYAPPISAFRTNYYYRNATEKTHVTYGYHTYSSVQKYHNDTQIFPGLTYYSGDPNTPKVRRQIRFIAFFIPNGKGNNTAAFKYYE